ncbi:hypothetical protein SBRY_11215 [Actinacidiphila bryophytorum]|uniref:Uncharacterized protein n=1 Tax=Actinacidiphila bryophytorum TaxID=1436133 RepID=A0A9W4E2V9_9ACTN|nr:hypothetical protein SBRY_11215 [Actinacidiphila bryophytorum]
MDDGGGLPGGRRPRPDRRRRGGDRRRRRGHRRPRPGPDAGGRRRDGDPGAGRDRAARARRPPGVARPRPAPGGGHGDVPGRAGGLPAADRRGVATCCRAAVLSGVCAKMGSDDWQPVGRTAAQDRRGPHRQGARRAPRPAHHRRPAAPLPAPLCRAR